MMATNLTVIWTALPNGIVPTDGTKLRLSLFATLQLTTDKKNATISDFPELRNWTDIVRTYPFKLQFRGAGGLVKVVTPFRVTNDFHPEMWAALFGESEASENKSIASDLSLQRKFITKVVSYEKPTPKVLSEAEILSYPVKELASNLKRTYGTLAHLQTLVKSSDPVAADVSQARNDIGSFVQDTGLYLQSKPSEQERLATLTAINNLDQYINRMEQSHRAVALSLKSLYISRISANDGRDLRPQTISVIQNTIARRIGGSRGVASDSTNSVSTSLLRFAAFHHLGQTTKRQDHLDVEEDIAETVPQFDVHEILTMVGNFPVLLRLLGLVIDVEISEADIEPSGTVRVVQAGGDTQDQPKTHYVLYSTKSGAKRFLTQPREQNPIVRDGLLNLRANGAFYIESMDVDGAVLKQLALSGSEDTSGSSTVGGTALDGLASREIPPALRTAGMSIIFSDRDEFLRDALSRAEQNAQDPRNAELWAEDLIRGFRADVFEVDTQTWYSLCQRNEKYHFLQPGSENVLFSWPAKDKDTWLAEGTISLGVTKPASTGTQEIATLAILQQHEALFRWPNWSLCVPFPQKPMNPNANTERTRKFESIKNTMRPLRLRTDLSVASGSLPKQRFGSKYWLRCRVVDPAGNSLTLGEVNPTDFSAALGDPNGTDPFTFNRYEPVPAPVLLLTGQLNFAEQPADQLDRMVVRDGGNAKERCCAPPRVAAMTAILHGKYDDNINRKEGALRGAQLDKKSGAFPRASASGAPEFQNPIFIYQPKNSEPPDQPYLPDPFSPAASVMLLDLKDRTFFKDLRENQVICPYFRKTESWPHAQPFLVRLKAAPSSQLEVARLTKDSSLDPFVAVAQVVLREGEVVKLKLSSTLADPYKPPVNPVLNQMALWNAHEQESGKDTKTKLSLQSLAIGGQLTLYSPPREVTLVHAVKKPVQPRLTDASVGRRALSSTLAEIEIELNLHRMSTGRIECEATWEEPIDDVTKPDCCTRAGSAHLKDEKIPLLAATAPSKDASPLRETYSVKCSQNFSDTKHRQVTYTARAGTRFREYYPQPPEPTSDGDRKRLALKERDTYTTALEPRTLSVPSTARPPAPRLAYVIPTFRWEQHEPGKTGLSSRRWGGGLRVYLDRPWYTSGEGEMLGVILYPAPKSEALCKVLVPYITQWGRDPIWGTNPLSNFPARTDFRISDEKKVRYEEGLTLGVFQGTTPDQFGCSGESDFRFSVLGFEPEYDRERRLWRCDIEMNPGKSYWPFVRLGLARYQPDSLDKADDCKLSAVVQAEFMQLTADRWANLQYDPDPHRVKVTVTGFTYQSRSKVPGEVLTETGNMIVAVEQSCSDQRGDLSWRRINVKESGPLGYVSPLAVETDANGQTAWSFGVTFPRSRKVSHYRLVILESEVIAQDKDGDFSASQDGTRIVYADILGV